MVRVRGVVLGGVSFALLAGSYSGVMAPLRAAAAGPAVTGVAPSSGPTAGGTSIVITGSGFTGATDVLIGTSDLMPCPATPSCFTFVSDAEIDLITPSGAAGTSDVQITAGGVTSSPNPPADSYTYQQPAPTITSVSPDSGQESGGAPSVTIGGTDFSGSGFTTSGVSFGGNPATPFTVNSASSITATPPAGTGQVDVTVTTQSTDGTSTLTSATGAADTYAYAPVPSVSNVAPGTGPTGGGNTVTLTGTGFMSSYGAGANYSAT
ncbi:MAG: IPT/TIG domain-containing protein, partial [Candidatus Dormiibacterota bacterium]